MSTSDWVLWGAAVVTFAVLVATLIVDYRDFSRAYDQRRRDEERRAYERQQALMRERVRARWYEHV